VNEFAHKTYAQCLELLANRYGAREAMAFRNERYSFRDLKDNADRASARLASLGLQPGDKVSIWMPNRPEFIWYWLGAAQMGLVAVMLNTRLKQEEVAYQLAQSESRAVIVPGPGGFRDFLADLTELSPGVKSGRPGELSSTALPNLRHVICCDNPGPLYCGTTDWSAPMPADLPLPPMATDPNAPALIAYSSGTTALPKGAMISHCLWRKSWDIGAPIDLTEQDCMYLSIPLFGSMATMNGVAQLWVRGGRAVIGEHFDARECLKVAVAERCTVVHLLPPMIHQICALPDLDSLDLSALRIAFVLSADLDVLDLVADRIGIPGVMTGYGMTETTTAVARNRWDASRDDRFSTQGRPLPDVEIRIADPETGHALPTGEAGEIWVRGYCVMLGYYKKPEETQKAMTPDGWFKTGDMGLFREDGRLVFKGRLGDGYKTRGFNVSPAEIEHALMQHPAVAAAAVIGVPDSDQGAIGIAYVIPKPGATPNAEEVLAFLRPKLSGYKMPRHVMFVGEFPLTAGTGKIQKFRLREDAMAKLGIEAPPAAKRRA
jgi:acyl-CoA synthetase (AMP-forming)/AMP-acid ligase II